MAFELPALPYDKSALEPHMSTETFDYHHGKHHKAYIDKVNGWVGDKGLSGMTMAEITHKAKDGGDKPLFNNAAQAWNHAFFWKCLAPAGQQPTGQLASLIEEAFGDTKTLLEKMAAEAVGHFGSGWAWLVLDEGALKLTSYHDADSPIVYPGIKPLLTLDVWEHAYYIDYRNARPKFAETVLANIVNWEFVAQNLDGEGEARGDMKQ